MRSSARTGPDRPPNFVVAAVTARRAIRSAAVWGAVFGLYATTSAIGYAATYKTPVARARLEQTFGDNLGFNALIGPAHQIGTVAGFTAWRSLGVLSIVGGVWGILVGTRLLRGEEDAGRWEVLLVGRTTRRGATGQALAGLAASLVALWAVCGSLIVAAGRSSSVQIGAGGALFLALSLVTSAAMFLCVGALTSQLAATRRQAAGYAAALLGVSYTLRMIADSGTGLGWLRAFSPLGWVEELQPLTAPRPALLVPITAFAAVLATATVWLAGHRDLGTGSLPDHSTSRPRTLLLTTPTRLAVRLSRGTLAAWAGSTTLTAVLMGLIAKSVGDALSADAGDRKAFAQLGFHGTGAAQYLGITFVIVALLMALTATGQLNAMREEEATGRLDNLLAGPMSRRRWLAGRIALMMTTAAMTSLLAGLAAWCGAASQHAGLSVLTLLQAGINVAPITVAVIAVGILTFGLHPRAVPFATYGLIAWSFLLEIVGSVVNASHWLLDTSIFHQVTSAPAIPPDWSTDLTVIAISALVIIIGSIAFNRRDLEGE